MLYIYIYVYKEQIDGRFYNLNAILRNTLNFCDYHPFYNFFFHLKKQYDKSLRSDFKLFCWSQTLTPSARFISLCACNRVTSNS